MLLVRPLVVVSLALSLSVAASANRRPPLAPAAPAPAAQAASAIAPAAPGTLQGRVTDPSGAVITQARVTVTAAHGVVRQATTNASGEFLLRGLPPGPASLSVTAKGFSPYFQSSLDLRARANPPLAIRMSLGTQQQQVVVRSRGVAVSLEPDQDTAGAVVLQGKALQTLSDDPDQLQTDLQALAGPSVGGSGGSISIDGFTRGDIPPKSAILEVLVNKNPFSAAYNHLGYGRIEIITKPGSQHFHGHLFVSGNSSRFNALNPFLAGTNPPAYHSLFYNFDAGGPLGKKISWFVAIERRNINEVSVVNTQVLSPSLTPQTYVTSVPNPRVRTAIAPRFDFQLTPNNILMVRYEYMDRVQTNNGVGGQDLPSQAWNDVSPHQNLQVEDTQILGTQVVNRTRYQYLHFHPVNTPSSTAPTLQVLGAFTGGGTSNGAVNRSETHNAGRDDLVITDGNHQIELGGFARDINRTESSTANFNGAFTFNSLLDYQNTLTGLQQGMTMAEIQAAGYGPSQFSITAGNPVGHVNRVDSALYAQDSWKLRPNILFSYGVRFESENVGKLHTYFAPRLGLAWGLGGGASPSTVLRAGAGIFLQPLDDDQMMTVAHLNGVTVQQYLVQSPDFYPAIPSTGTLAGLSSYVPTYYQIAPNLQFPSMTEAGVGIEHQFGHSGSLAVNYLHSIGNHQFLTNDINAPLPGTYNPANPASGQRPLGNAAGNIYQFQSNGIFRQNQLTANFHYHPGAALSLFGYFSLNSAHSDTAGVYSFPTNPWNLMANYGPAPYDIHERLFLGGNINLPWHVMLTPFMVAHSGVPYSITLNQDLFGTGQFNGRPSLATASTPAADVIQTPYGAFNLHPTAADTLIAPNTEIGPGAFTLNLHFRKRFGFGGPAPHSTGSSSEQRYRLTLGIVARNIFNTVNLAPPVGNLNSPLFGHSISLAGGPFSSGAANRRIDLQASIDF